MWRFVCMVEPLLQPEEEKKLQELPSPANCWIILAKPTLGVSTADIYGNLKVNEIKHPNTNQMIEAIQAKRF